MAVDHANFFISRTHPTGEFWGILLPQYDSALSFLTRFITQFCAPGFFLLLGAGMFLFAESRRAHDWTPARIRRHLIIRGLILFLLQFIIENPAWLMGPEEALNPPGAGGQVWFHFGVLSCLGMVMIFWAVLYRLKPGAVFGLSAAAILLTQFLTPDPSQAQRLYHPLLRILLIPGKTGSLQVFYSLVPWLGYAGLGLILGRWLRTDARRAYRRALVWGTLFLALFFVVRIPGGFGNIHPSESSGWMDFLNLTKYPPSLAFLFLTLGANLILLNLFSLAGYRLQKRGNPLLVFGRSALFFYLVHLYLYTIMGFPFAGRGGSGIPLMYVFWLLGLLILYPLCVCYGEFKQKKGPASIWRFF
jgi:uncharacterized membrane protein